MPRYSAEQIYGFARRAGFSPDQSATMTAIALAESNGNSRAHNPHGEDSRGLWQINALAHPALAAGSDLYDPLENARAAYEVSRGGADVSPWTTTHGGTSARYVRYREDAEAAAVSYGDGRGRGVWTGTSAYGHSLAAGADDGTVPGSDRSAAAGGGAVEKFLDVARAQVGDRYVFGAETNLDDRDPTTFDCSELTQWAAHQAGAEIPDGAAAQYLYLKERGLVVPVDRARNTPGALLFSFDHEPRTGEGRQSLAHVAISLGNGRTIEAQSPKSGVGEFDAGHRFQYAAVVPGISDGTSGVTPVAEESATVEPVLPAKLGGADTDRDGLTDAMEHRLGLDATSADTDHDNLPDAYELVTSHSDPHLADTDHDQLNDAFELARGLDPGSPDTDQDGHLDGSFGTPTVDADQDGLDDQLELVLGTDPHLADTDADGFGDALESHSGGDPLDASVTPLHHTGSADDPTSGFMHP